MNRKYTEEMREQTVAYYLESGRSQRKVSEEVGIGINTLTRWINQYREKHGIPDRSKTVPSNEELIRKIKELEQESKEKTRRLAAKEKELQDAKLKVEILKKSLHIFMEPDA